MTCPATAFAIMTTVVYNVYSILVMFVNLPQRITSEFSHSQDCMLYNLQFVLLCR